MTGMIFANSERRDPYKNFRFSVDFVGRTKIVKSGWNGVTGMSWVTDYKEYKEGGNNESAEQIPTDTRFEPITLRKGMSESFEIVKTIRESYGAKGNGVEVEAFMDVIIRIHDRIGDRAVRTIFLRNAWISAYRMSDLDAQGNEVLMEEITLSYNGVDF